MRIAAKTRKNDELADAMASFVAMFNSIEDALAFEKAALSTPNVHLPPIARSVRDGGQRTTLYWRWLTVSAEVWS